MTIATTSNTAIIETLVGIVLVTIIASFISPLTNRSVHTEKSIATAGGLAPTGTTIFFVIVAIIAPLEPWLSRAEILTHKLVPTGCPAATDTGVLTDVITIITGLPLRHNTIAASTKRTGTASNTVGFLTGFACLKARLPGHEITAKDTISTASKVTGVRALIESVCIAIVALFTGVDDSIEVTGGQLSCWLTGDEKAHANHEEEKCSHRSPQGN
jgi:hypothetical protein